MELHTQGLVDTLCGFAFHRKKTDIPQFHKKNNNNNNNNYREMEEQINENNDNEMNDKKDKEKEKIKLYNKRIENGKHTIPTCTTHILVFFIEKNDICLQKCF